jgi:hypothetical protein
MKNSRKRANHPKGDEPGKAAPEPEGAAEPSSEGKTGLSPEVWGLIVKFGTVVVETAPKLIDAIKTR